MFWVAIATLVMMLSGEGDDVGPFMNFLAALKKGVAAHVTDPGRKTEALAAVSSYEVLFREHREKLNELAACLEKTDRSYQASAATYEACQVPLDAHWEDLRLTLEGVQARLSANIRPEELAKIDRALSEDTDVQAALRQHEGGKAASAQPPPRRRRRGLTGVVTQRQLTAPRNTLTVLFGPGLTPTFGQRFPLGPVEAGTNFRHIESGVGTSEQWIARLGVVFGITDNLEVGALFLPIELSPDPHFDDVTVLASYQFHFQQLDVAARLSFRTPGQIGWALNPGVAARYRPTRSLALDAALQLPFELGSLDQPREPLLACNVPLRATWNLTPQLFALGNAGFAVDDLSNGASAVLPLGAGAGYTLLVGSRLLDLTATFDWEGLVHLAPAANQDAIQPGSYRFAFGLNLHSQAL